MWKVSTTDGGMLSAEVKRQEKRTEKVRNRIDGGGDKRREDHATLKRANPEYPTRFAATHWWERRELALWYVVEKEEVTRMPGHNQSWRINECIVIARSRKAEVYATGHSVSVHLQLDFSWRSSHDSTKIPGW